MGSDKAPIKRRKPRPDLVARNFKHGLAVRGKKHPLYDSWSRMWQRCTNPNDKDFKYYGDRCITVCPQWKDFAAFVRDMGERPPGLELDRRNNNGNYEPSNCRWTTRSEQIRNSRHPGHPHTPESRAKITGRPRKPHCKRGHLFTPTRAGRQVCRICMRNRRDAIKAL